MSSPPTLQATIGPFPHQVGAPWINLGIGAGESLPANPLGATYLNHLWLVDRTLLVLKARCLGGPSHAGADLKCGGYPMWGSNFLLLSLCLHRGVGKESVPHCLLSTGMRTFCLSLEARSGLVSFYFFQRKLFHR